MIADDFLKLLSVKYLDLQYQSHYIVYGNIMCQCRHPPLHTGLLSFMYITFSACQFQQVWCWDVDQMLYFTLEKHKTC